MGRREGSETSRQSQPRQSQRTERKRRRRSGWSKAGDERGRAESSPWLHAAGRRRATGTTRRGTENPRGEKVGAALGPKRQAGQTTHSAAPCRLDDLLACLPAPLLLCSSSVLRRRSLRAVIRCIPCHGCLVLVQRHAASPPGFVFCRRHARGTLHETNAHCSRALCRAAQVAVGRGDRRVRHARNHAAHGCGAHWSTWPAASD